MLIAKDLMKKSTPTLSFDSRVEEAIDFLNTHDVQFVAVNASADRYHGVLTEASMMRIYLRYQTQKEKEALIFYRDLFEPIQLIQESEVFPEVVKKVVTAVGHRVFVINSNDQVVGYLTAKDIMPYLIETLGGEKRSAVAKTAEKMKDKTELLNGLRSDLYLYESFFEKSPFMMHSADQSGVIQMANEMLHRVLGYEYGDLIGKTIYDLYPEKMHEAAKAGLQKILTKGYHNVIQSQMRHKNGTLIDVELVSRALFDQNDRALGTMTVSRPLDMKYLLEVLPVY